MPSCLDSIFYEIAQQQAQIQNLTTVTSAAEASTAQQQNLEKPIISAPQDKMAEISATPAMLASQQPTEDARRTDLFMSRVPNERTVKIRGMLEKAEHELTAALGPLPTGLQEFYHEIELPNGYVNRVKIVRPAVQEGVAKGSPLILLFHGGGFLSGGVEQMTRPIRDFASIFNAVVVSATYRRAPENKFPTGIEDAWHTLEWFAAHASDDKIGADLSKGFVVGGFSAGAHIASVLSALAIERNLNPMVTGTFISIPSIGARNIIPDKYKHLYTSPDDFRDDPMLGGNAMEETLLTLGADIKSPLFSVFNASQDVVKQLPKTYVHVGGKDVLRDDGVVYEQYLRDLGVQTRLDIAQHLAHDGYTIWYNRETQKELETGAKNGVAWLLNQEERY